MTPTHTAWARMLSGQTYDACDQGLSSRLASTRRLLWRFNALDPDSAAGAEGGALLRQLFGQLGEGFTINQPLRCDYGCNICVGRNFFANFGLTILDEAAVTIGDDVFLGPDVSIYTACHPLDPAQRRGRVEWALPVTIGDDVWIGGGVTLCPGVSIGPGSTIGAGSVVTRSVPAHVVAAGNPCRVIRYLDVTDGGGCGDGHGDCQQLGLDSCAG